MGFVLTSRGKKYGGTHSNSRDKYGVYSAIDDPLSRRLKILNVGTGSENKWVSYFVSFAHTVFIHRRRSD